MHEYCDRPRRCRMQTDTCESAKAKEAAGNGCVSMRTLIQQRCFSPGCDPGYHTHMQQLAEAYAALRNCQAIASAKCRKEPPTPVPVPERVPEVERDYDTEQERRRIIEESPLPVWAKYALNAIVGILTVAAVVGIIACFASGACEIAIIVGGLGAAAAAAVIAILNTAGITDTSEPSA